MRADHNHNAEHIPDGELLLAAGGELAAGRAREIAEHLDGCAACRSRLADLERTLADVVQAHHGEFDRRLPPMEASRFELRARMAAPRQKRPRLGLAWAAAVAGVGAALALWPNGSGGAFAPNAVLTPGGVRPITRDAVCSAAGGGASSPVISAAVAREVFRRYGIQHPRPRTYEVDYLIPPTLGGSLDAGNLWPQPYSAGVWNARVKDALEERLRTLVCEGNLDLATAQRDLARDWIAAYKKYFHTGAPLLDHMAFVKDRPWE
jgi:hypothetical protein